jgi:predicted PP-loop superfamily ATPase
MTMLPTTDVMAGIDRLLSEAKIGPRDGAGKTVVAMSGGVDGAVTALIMRERGYRVVGMNLRLERIGTRPARVQRAAAVSPRINSWRV